MKDKKAFTLAEIQKNISHATYRGRGIKGEGVIKHAAFTLAETLIVLVILGVIASITIPAVIRNQIEAQNRTRIKKAMTVYDTAINKIVVENGIKSNDALYSSNPNDNTAFAPQNNCTRSSAYFKILRTLNDDNGTNCRFCSSDNVCWDISNILKPIIGIGEEGITNENSNNRYRMFAHFGDNGELRVDDLAYEQNHEYLTDDEKEELVALYNFTNNKKEEKSPSQQLNECKEKGNNSCTVNGITYTKVTLSATTFNNEDFYSGSLCLWDSTQNKRVCGIEEIKTNGGTYYVADIGFPSNYDILASDLTGSNCSTMCQTESSDYHNAAKKYCEQAGGRLPNLAEHKALNLKSTGYGYWANEEDGDIAYAYNQYFTSNGKAGSGSGYGIVCIFN